MKPYKLNKKNYNTRLKSMGLNEEEIKTAQLLSKLNGAQKTAILKFVDKNPDILSTVMIYLIDTEFID